MSEKYKDSEPSGLEASSVWNELTPGSQELAKQAASAIAEMPLFEGKDLTAGDFRVVKTSFAGKDDFAVIYAKTEPLLLGNPENDDPARSWNGLMNGLPSEATQVTLDGGKGTVDIRSAQTHELLDAVAVENPEIDESVWETANLAGASHDVAPAIVLHSGQAWQRVFLSPNNGRQVGFRPAVDLVSPAPL